MSITWYTPVKDIQCPICKKKQVVAVHPFDYIKQCENKKCPALKKLIRGKRGWKHQWLGGGHN
jgi:hypothetical protein